VTCRCSHLGGKRNGCRTLPACRFETYEARLAPRCRESHENKIQAVLRPSPPETERRWGLGKLPRPSERRRALLVQDPEQPPGPASSPGNRAVRREAWRTDRRAGLYARARLHSNRSRWLGDSAGVGPALGGGMGARLPRDRPRHRDSRHLAKPDDR
jgi:hypothetical protein